MGGMIVGVVDDKGEIILDLYAILSAQGPLGSLTCFAEYRSARTESTTKHFSTCWSGKHGSPRKSSRP